MNSVAGSTGPSATELERRLGSVAYAQLAPAFDELVQLRTEKAQAQRRGQHAGTARASRVQSAITVMAEARALQLCNWTGSNKAKCMFIQRHIANAIADNNGMWMQLTRTPHIRTIFKVINGLRM